MSNTIKTEINVHDVPFATAYFVELPLVGELVQVGQTWYNVKSRHHVLEHKSDGGSGRRWYEQSAVLNLV
jgi:hypothetical protein